MKNKHSLPFLVAFLIAILIAGLSTTALALEKRDDGLVYAGWQKIETSNKLPAHPLFVASSKLTGDFVAVAKDAAGVAHFYFLGHDNFSNGWQETGTFDLGAHGDVDCLKSGFGKYFAFGVDNDRHVSVVATSYDNGQSWSQSDMPGDAAHYDSVAFADVTGMFGLPGGSGKGVVTGRDGAVAVTAVDLNWSNQNINSVTWVKSTCDFSALSGPKNVVWTNLNARSNPFIPDYEFVLSTPRVDPAGLVWIHNGYIPNGSFSSLDGATWSPINQALGGIVTTSFPLSLDQVLCFDHEAYFTDHTNNAHDNFAFENSADLGITIQNKTYALFQSDTPLVDLSHFYNERLSLYLVGIGTNQEQQPVSIVSPASSGTYRVFTIDPISFNPVDLAVGAFESTMINAGKPYPCCVTIDESGDTYYTLLGFF